MTIQKRILSTSCGLMVAAAIAIGAGVLQCELIGDAGEGEVRVVRAAVTWSEGGRDLSVVHVAEPERHPHFEEPWIVGREIRTAASAMMMVVRLLASGTMDG